MGQPCTGTSRRRSRDEAPLLNATYSKEADAYYVTLRRGKSLRQVHVGNGDTILDLNEHGTVLGIEVLNASGLDVGASHV